MADKEGYLFTDTANIYYEIFGLDKPPVVFLYGSRVDRELIKAQIKSISKLFQVITIDNRGHGNSSFGSYPLTTDLMAKDVSSVLKHLQIERVCIIGFNDGGNIALQFAIHYPRDVSRLILLDVNINPMGIKFKVQFPLVLKYILYRFLSIFSKRFKRRLSILSLKVMEPNILPKDLKSIAVPTLVLTGEDDIVKKEHIELIADAIPKARLENLPKTDYSFGSLMGKVNLIMISFLRGNLER